MANLLGIANPTAAESEQGGSGSILGHTLTAATMGTGFAAFLTWILQIYHVNPPAAVAQWFSALCMVAASVAMARLGKYLGAVLVFVATGAAFKKILVLGAIALALSACATSKTDPQQTIYAAKSSLITAIQVATIYAKLPRCPNNPVPCSDQATVDNINKAANAADAAIEAAEMTVRNPQFSQSTVDASVIAAQNAVDAFTKITADLKVQQ